MVMGNSDEEIDKALAQLQTLSSTTGVSVFDHLTNVVAQILTEQTSDPVDLLETSYLVKRTTSKSQRRKPIDTVEDPHREESVRGFLNLLSNPEPSIDAETGEPIDPDAPNEYTCNDILGDAALFKALGIDLSSRELIAVAHLAKRLGEEPSIGVSTIRFFGKFLTLKDPYFIFETELKTNEEVTSENEDDVPMEVGTGVNAYVYFVTFLPNGAFRRLPDAKPKHICSARSIRRFLTGDLDSDVSAFPLFSGNEADYLRAQIARIRAATLLCPSGEFFLNEEGVLEKNEELSDHTQEQRRDLANWCHLSPHLKKQGRCVLHVRTAPEGEEESFQLNEEEQEEGPELLGTVDRDQGPSFPTWTVLSSSRITHLPHQVLGLRSNVWPGAISAAKGTHFANVYVGWGIKNAPCSPPSLPEIQSEFGFASLTECNALPAKPIEEEASEEKN